MGFQHAVVRTRGGRAYAWGKGERGQLGNGATASHPSAFPVDLPEGTPPVLRVGGMGWKWSGVEWMGWGGTMDAATTQSVARP